MRMADDRTRATPGGPLPPGTPAPDFSLPSDPDGGRIALAELRGRPVVLAFYPADWSPVCGDQIVELSGRLAEFARRGAAVVGISVDGPWSHAAFAAARGIGFPLLADFEPKGAVARAYGVYRTKDGIADRAIFLLDGDGVIRWREVVEPWINPGVDGVLAALDALPAPTGAAR
jgi:peroxiredoxin